VAYIKLLTALAYGTKAISSISEDVVGHCLTESLVPIEIGTLNDF